jgi:GNAT superfamily N-acetyltransferase
LQAISFSKQNIFFMLIKQATLADLSVLTDLFEGYRHFYKKEANRDGAMAFLKERLEKNESVVFLAVAENGETVGFTQLFPLFSSTRMKRLWLLNDLYVLPEYRGQGFSKALIERAKALAIETDACEVMLETAKTNDIGNQLYPSVGFELGTDFNWYHWENS